VCVCVCSIHGVASDTVFSRINCSHSLHPLLYYGATPDYSESCYCCCCYLYNIHMNVSWYFIPGKQFSHSFIPDRHCIFLNAVLITHLHQSYFFIFIFFKTTINKYNYYTLCNHHNTCTKTIGTKRNACCKFECIQNI